MTDTSIYRLPPLPSRVRPLSTEHSSQLAAQYPNLPRSPKECITCRGKQVFRWYAPNSRDPGTIGEYECSCVDQFILHRVMLYSGIPTTYQRIGWLDFAGDVGVVAQYLENWEAHVASGYGLILHGTIGSGKTLLSYLILKFLLSYGVDVYGATFNQMLSIFGESWSDKNELARFNRQIRNAGVLFVDDVGRERHQESMLTKEQRVALGADSGIVRNVTQHAESVLEEVVRHRTAHSTPTLITTNLTLTQIQQGYGGNTMSLLHERSRTMEFNQADWRSRQKERLDFEIDNKLTRPIVIQ